MRRGPEGDVRMSLEFRLPDLGEGLSEAELIEWHVAEDDHVVEDQPLADIQTDKAIVELPCPAAGTIEHLCAEPGDVVAVGEVLVVIATADHAPVAVAHAARQESLYAPAPAAAPATKGSGAVRQPPGRRPLASPAVRRHARELGINLWTVTGSGPGGRTVRGDLTADQEPASADAAAGADEAPGAMAPVLQPGEVQPLRGLRRAIAKTLTDAWQTVPRVIDYREVQVDALFAARGQLKQCAVSRGDAELARAMTVSPLLMKVVAVALRRHPLLNASIDLAREEITVHKTIEMGVATATPDGLLVPVIRDAGRKNIVELARESAALAAAARDRRLTSEQLVGGTITINNYGALGIWLGTPIVVPPQVANIGFGKMQEKPVVVDGEIVIRRIVPLACAGDHRLLDGHTIAAFVNDLVALIEQPYALLGELV